jgi:4-amino-4-deoxy-L-arabinose transferase-like glycosyltransferase
MTRPIMPDEGAPRTRPAVDARQLWAAAVVAALVALVGVVVCRWLFNIALLSPSRAGAYGDAHTTDVVLLAAAAALLATGLLHLLLAATPRPLSFFSWIVGLVTLLMVLFPFSTSAPRSQKIATAVVDLVIGFAIGVLLNGVGARSMRRRQLPPAGGPGYNAPYPPDQYRPDQYQQGQWGPGQWPAQPPGSSTQPDPRDYPRQSRGPAN